MLDDDLKEIIEYATNNKGKLFFDDFDDIISKNIEIQIFNFII